MQCSSQVFMCRRLKDNLSFACKRRRLAEADKNRAASRSGFDAFDCLLYCAASKERTGAVEERICDGCHEQRE